MGGQSLMSEVPLDWGVGVLFVDSAAVEGGVRMRLIRRWMVLHRVSSSLLGPVDPSFRALFERLKLTVRLHKFNFSLSLDGGFRTRLGTQLALYSVITCST